MKYAAEHKIGNLLEGVKQGIIVHQVNCQGVMGGGIAKEIRAKWPVVWEEYSAYIGPPNTQRDKGLYSLGAVVYTSVGVAGEPPLIVANLFGQQFFGRDGKRYTSYDALDMGFQNVAIHAMKYGLEVHYPTIGCGLGGGNWTIVSAIIEANLDTIKHTHWELPS